MLLTPTPTPDHIGDAFYVDVSELNRTPLMLARSNQISIHSSHNTVLGFILCLFFFPLVYVCPLVIVLFYSVFIQSKSTDMAHIHPHTHPLTNNPFRSTYAYRISPICEEKNIFVCRQKTG